MRKLIIKLIRKLIKRFIDTGGLEIILVGSTYRNYITTAEKLISEFEWRPDGERRNLSGEYKRHQVYARLIKIFPEAKKRDLSFAIEVVLQGNLKNLFYDY